MALNDWQNGQAGGTPLSAERLNERDAAIVAAQSAVTAAASTAVWGSVSGKPSTFPPVIGTTATTALAGNTPIPAAATWANISGKPAVVAAGADAAAARTAIGAGTGNSNLALGTTGTTAAAGDHTHTAAQVGAAPASHTHTAAQVNVAADATNGIEVGTLQAALSALAARVVALETP
ncbi:hypothetical protein EV641_109186 [Rhodococcus sp. SMB37]|uniref:hypothetical protein n=1 Tax=Rhodococcus sp. SMB37 TaxID=2512213 RepID=UPI00104A63FB|nr:hypothetical protein [Rhodococcus sp. SMB37]TCN51795.1 hypothetical protein EV641_109186 [Rhodococcus sp. SMB37]